MQIAGLNLVLDRVVDVESVDLDGCGVASAFETDIWFANCDKGRGGLCGFFFEAFLQKIVVYTSFCYFKISH